MSIFLYTSDGPKLADKIFYYPNGSKKTVKIIYRRTPNYWIPVFPNPLKIIRNKVAVDVYRRSDGSYSVTPVSIEHLYSKVTYDWTYVYQDHAGFLNYEWEYEDPQYEGLVIVKAKYSDMGIYFVNTTSHVVAMSFSKSSTYSGLELPIGNETRIWFKYQLIGLPRDSLRPVPDEYDEVYYIPKDLHNAEIVYDNW